MQRYIIEKDGRKSLAKELVCDNCNINFLKTIRFINSTNNYCSRQCASLSSRNRVTLYCSLCSKEFEKVKSALKKSKSGLYFCTRKCKDKAQRLEGIKEIQPPHYGTGKSSYREIAFRNFDSKCNKCGYDEHIKILEVHHKDRNRDNNNLDNLEIICPNCHRLEHKK